ncbi:polyprotein [Brome streak mosaic virus]|uniref:Genome polyprotein n=11 Tax=Brome streak mosaic virus TaxID=42631 RepID=POLG_BSTV1|nr:polyprotein [Brome streak mosaic virus]Q65730.1 RecName: Full=Genome polyprotein; Contains: RecName: Full=P1 proteinase; AltName: Full=N-terminal protein; Contains: RecName: Full=Helper component proteinase; Short=HC-pro; Contains: RecName: Full=Protein P3; Contains: RecName: Full=6 kDa protein 1; Short=6K1; Contains: RecName: Full=Cytoplasmic inclusion protein; Short=CI; Contains: RecName: Full=6 kDa protein 2; Short=6K2; Contains: RecName: Full=Viral genome-linked protein; AltName: Full=VPg; 
MQQTHVKQVWRPKTASSKVKTSNMVYLAEESSPLAKTELKEDAVVAADMSVINADDAVYGHALEGKYSERKALPARSNETIVSFASGEDGLFLDRAACGSIFKTRTGKDTPIATAIRAATRRGLAYDIAAQLYMCPKCCSASDKVLYFDTNHNDSCQWYLDNCRAVINKDWTLDVIETYNVFPVLVTEEEERRTLEAVDIALKPLGTVPVHDVVQVYDQKIGEHKEVERNQEAAHGSEPAIITTTPVLRRQCIEKRLLRHVHQANKVIANTVEIYDLMTETSQICAEKAIPLVFVDYEKKKRIRPRVPLRHVLESNNVDPSDDLYADVVPFLKHYGTCGRPVGVINPRDIKPGWSGVVLLQDELPESLHQECVDGVFVVQGIGPDGQLKNALKTTTGERIEYYSSKRRMAVNAHVPKAHSFCKYSSLTETLMELDYLRVISALADVHDPQCVECHKERNERSFIENLKYTQQGAQNLFNAGTGMGLAFVASIASGQLMIQRQQPQSSSSIVDQTPRTNEDGSLSHNINLLLTPEVVDIWRSMKQMVHLPNRKLYMASFNDQFGNFDFIPNSTLQGVFPDFTMPVTIALNDDDKVETNYRHVDKNSTIETCVEGLYTQFDAAYWTKKAAQVHKIQPIDQCGMEIGNIALKLCHWEGDVALFSPIIRPTPGHLMFGSTDRLLRIPDMTNARHYVPKVGYCYLYLFALAMNFCDGENRVTVDAYINKTCRELGAWPKFGEVLRALDRMATYYGCYDAVVPVMLVDHVQRTIHVPSPFGIVQSGMHMIQINNLGDLIKLDTMGASELKEYEIGGFRETYKSITKCVKSKSAFMEKLNQDNEWLVDMICNPSTLFVLSQLMDTHGLILKDVENSFDRLAALLALKELGSALGPLLTTRKRVALYMQSLSKVDELVPHLGMPTGAMNLLKSEIELIQNAIVEEQDMAEIDRVEGKKSILERRDEMFAPCVYNEFINSFGYVSLPGIAYRLTYTGVGARIGRGCEHLKTVWSGSWIPEIHLPENLRSNTWSAIKKYTVYSGGTAWRYMKLKIVESATQILVAAVITAIGSWLLKKLLKFIRHEKGRLNEVVVFQSKQEELFISKFMAVCFVISTFFSLDMSNAIYSSLTKFRAIFSILSVGSIYQSGALEKLEEQLGHVDTFHEFKLYDHDATHANIAPSVQSFGTWLDTRVLAGQQGCDPLEGRHTKFEMNKNTRDAIAARVLADKDNEFLVMGHVGCGKSTYFPVALSKQARVLICEPTRVLVTNLHDSMMHTCQVAPSVMMRNHRCITGSSIMVQTYGFALHYLVNNPENLQQYDFVLFDEVHHTCAEKVVLYNWLKGRDWGGKIVKLTATDRSPSAEIKAQKSLDIMTLPTMTPLDFVKEQGLSTKADASKHGKVILVFLTSFREVDSCYDELKRKENFDAIKADSRNLRNKTSLADLISECKKEFIYIFATNILQTGINIEADVVVDFGYKIVPTYDVDNRMLTTTRKPVNKADRIQRLGRVARMKAGVAMKIGATIDPEAYDDEVTATEAALLSFAMQVPPVLRNVNLQIFQRITREQVVTAARFEHQLSYMVWMVNKDGSMPTKLYDLFSPLLLSQGNMRLSPYYSSLYDSDTFMTVKNYVDIGYLKHDRTTNQRLPFHCHDVSTTFAMKVADRFEDSRAPSTYSIRVPAVNLRHTAVKLSTDPAQVGMILVVIGEALVHQKNILEQLKSTRTQLDNYNSCILVPNWNVRGKLDDAINRVERNVSILENQKNSVEKMSVARGYDELKELLEENHAVAAHVMYQKGPQKFIDDVLLQKRDFSWMPYISVGAACLMAGCAWYMLYRQRAKHEAKFEGKASRVKASKQKAFDDKMARADNYTYYETTDELHNHAREWNDYPTDWVDKVRKKANVHAMQFGREAPRRDVRNDRPFFNFYGIDEKLYDTVTFHDMAASFSVEQPITAMEVEEAFEKIYLNRQEDEAFFDHPMPKKILAEFKGKDGKVINVEMEPHNPRKANRRGLPVGYADHRGEFRQAKPAEEGPIKFERKALNPKATPYAVFESKALYGGPRCYEHITNNQVLLAGPSGYLNGLITGSKLLAPYHFVKDISSDSQDPSRMIARFGTYNLGNILNLQVVKFTMIDLIGLDLPVEFQPRRTLKCFRVPVIGEKAVLVLSRYSKEGWKSCVSAETEITPYGENEELLWRHRITTEVGDCGATMVALSDQKIVGFHSLGGISMNYFVPVTQELLDFLSSKTEKPLVPWRFSEDQVDVGGLYIHNDFDKFPFVKTIQKLVGFQNGHMIKYCGEGFTPVARSENRLSRQHVISGQRESFIHFVEASSKWRPLITPMLGRLQPSALNREAYYKDVLKYDKPIRLGTVHEEAFQSAVINVIRILENAGFERGGVKACFDYGKIFNDLNLDAAMGALYAGKKKDYFVEATDEEIEEMFLRSAGKICANGHGVWSALLKAELRPAEKVAANKTRTFTSAPIDILFGAKAVVDDFNKQFYKRHLLGPWTVGINKFNKGWDLLARSLMRYEWFIDADGSQFDSSITPLLMNAVLTIRLYFMERDDITELMLRNLYTQIISTCMLAEDGLIVQKHRGNNSGQPSTVVDNTLCLMIAMEYARQRAISDGHLNMQMRYVCNGDDLLINANEEAKDVVQGKYEQYIKELELNYCFDDAFQSIEGVEFMSHKFMLRNGIYIPKLARHRIVAILEWQRSAEPQAIKSAILAACVEAFGYDDLTELIREYAISLEPVWGSFLPTDGEIEQLYFEGIAKQEVARCLAGVDDVCKFESAASGTNEAVDEVLKAAGDDEALARANAAATSGATTPAQNVGAGTTTPAKATPQSGRRPSFGSLIDNPIGGNGVQDVADRTSGIVFPVPTRKSTSLYLPPKVKLRATPERIEKVRKYLPDPQQIDLRYSTQQELNDWIKASADGLGQTEEAFIDNILPGWIVHCIVNTTSSENRKAGSWRCVTNAGTADEEQVLYDIEPMYSAANPTMRAIMRHFSDLARLVIAESFKQGRPLIPKGYIKAGVLDASSAAAACDFVVRDRHDTATFVQVQNQVLVNRVSGITNRLFAQAMPSAGANEDMARHDAQDAAEGIHNLGGARAF